MWDVSDSIEFGETSTDLQWESCYNYQIRVALCQPPLTWLPPSRTFGTASRLSANRKAPSKPSKVIPNQKKAGGSSTSNGGDPFDFTTLNADFSANLERLKTDLSKLRVGGRFNPDVLENLRVKPDKTSQQTVKVYDLAQVIPKGRTVHIMVSEKDHVKPIASAIQASTLSLTPQPDPTGANPSLLVVQIPPSTADSRRAAVSEAAKAGEKAGNSIRDARAKHHKKLRAMQVSNAARPDDLVKAGKAMEKLVEQSTAEVKRIVEGGRKVLESG